ncbi:MAG: alpha/beta fold hydrolase [Bacteroidaceae bacterium]|nr:alpha/beta fold hydrolase [Bacteroidaceae bacterium]
MKRLALFLLVIASMSACKQEQKPVITRSNIQLQSDTLTPEALWAMGRIGSYAISPDGSKVAYQVTYYSVEENRSNAIIYVQDIPATTDTDASATGTYLGPGSDPVWLSNSKLAFANKGEIWTMNAKGKSRKQLTKTDGAVEGFLFSPDQKRVIIVKSIPYHDIIKDKPADLPQTTGRVITDLMYRHWDHYVESIPHPFVCSVSGDGTVKEEFDILEGEPYECPMEPFGGIEQLAWSPDSKYIAFTCRTKTGIDYSISTDSDIFLYDVESGDMSKTKNLCKDCGEFGVVPDGGFVDSPDHICNPTKTLKDQFINTNLKDYNVGYDTNPKFSPDGKYVAWLSMERDGYESDRQRLCIFDLQKSTKTYVTESFDSSVDDFCWAPDSYTLYYIGVWHATENLYQTNLEGQVTQLTELQADWGALQIVNRQSPNSQSDCLLMERHDYFHPADLYVVSVPHNLPNGNNSATITQLTHENDHILSQLAPGSSEARWCATTDNQQLLYWVIKPPHFDSSKKYPTLLFCEGGPQSPVSQFWSYRWNFYIMASQGYVIIAPNRRGLPGFGQEWLEEISGDWTGQCMHDYLSAIDDACDNLPYVDRDRLAAVGASFGGFSVYYLAGHHDKRFKCFIAHDGAFNLEAMYTETEENWFSNWEYDDAYWNKDRTANADRTYKNSPHLFVDQWDTPILCIHGEKDYRINATQGMSAFNAARMRGIEAELLLFPDENHWVLKPQNGILWQRTYFDWLSRWLK